MINEAQKTSLSLPWQRLVEMMQKLGFGRIERLFIRNGEPVFKPLPRVVRVVKFGGENGPRRELRSRNFKLKGHVVELISEFGRLEDGTEVSIEVKHGLPFRMTLKEQV
jgi:hypothetical protein